MKRLPGSSPFTTIVAFLVIYLVNVAIVVAVPQTVTFYDGSQMTGNSITFGQKEPNITNYSFFQDRSHCFVGSWFLYKDTNFMRRDFMYRAGCWPNSSGYMQSIKSVRFLGARDTDTTSIAFYAVSRHEGEEFVLNYASEPSVPFRPASIFVRRGSGVGYNYTLHERENFVGPSVCFVPRLSGEIQLMDVIDYNLWDLAGIGSVRRGCDMGQVAGDGKPLRIVYAPESLDPTRS